jgi:hypothetical protein
MLCSQKISRILFDHTFKIMIALCVVVVVRSSGAVPCHAFQSEWPEK